MEENKKPNSIVKEDFLDPNLEDNHEQEPEKKKKISPIARYIINIVVILVATAAALALTLASGFDSVVTAFQQCDYRWVLVIAALMVCFFALESLILFCFARLYTRKYKYHQAVACDMVGTFYNGVTPMSSGGQIFQARTFSKQGVPISSAASILVMFFIIYQSVLVIYGILSFIFKYDLINGIGGFKIMDATIPIWPLTIIGFALNSLIIGLLFLMSYSRGIHRFILNHGVNLGAKLRIIKKPNKTRETIRVQVENFRIELRRLQSNVPFTILIVLMFVVLLTIKFSIPYFAGLAMDGLNNKNITAFWDSCFLSCYHLMVTGLIPLPGSAGSAEIFFSSMFYNNVNPTLGYYTTLGITNAALIIWRTSTFTIPLMIAGVVAAFYKSSAKEAIPAGQSERQTFVDLQLKTFEERKISSDTSYQTAQLSRKAIQNRLKPKRFRKEETIIDENSVIVYFNPAKYYKISKKKPSKEKAVSSKYRGYTEIDISNSEDNER